jgi:Putative collagen-binding domain of a collagenase
MHPWQANIGFQCAAMGCHTRISPLPGTDVSSSFVVAYLPRGGKIAVRLDKVTGKSVKARWFDPRSGRWREAGEYPSTGSREFVAPSAGDRRRLGPRP